VSSLRTTRFPSAKGGKETRQRANRRSAYACFVLLLPRSSPADQTRWWSFQSRKQTASPKKGQLHEKSYPSNDEE
jgi:hypothetical protein